MKTVTLKQFKKMKIPLGHHAAALLPMIAIKDPAATKKEPRNPIGYYVPGYLMRALTFDIRQMENQAEQTFLTARRVNARITGIPGGRS